MRLCHYSITLIVCFTYLSLDHSPVSSVTQNLADKIDFLNKSVEIGDLGTRDPSRGLGVMRNSRPQSEIKGNRNWDHLVRNSSPQPVDSTLSHTINLLQAQAELDKKDIFASSNSAPTTKNQQSGEYNFVWWLLVAIAVLGTTGALLYLIKRFSQGQKVADDDTSALENSSQTDTNQLKPSHREPDTIIQTPTTSGSIKLLPPSSIENTSRLAKVNIVDELITDLSSSDPIKRRKAIWNLGQQGDSRAVQPLIDLMIDADSQQRSLILAALAEIGISTLKPMNQALAMSLQDQSPQVRQNAIRDLTRVYDMMAQISQMLCHAVQDSDAEVQATARYALAQMNRIRNLPIHENVKDN